MKSILRFLAAAVLLCAPIAAQAQTPYGTTDLSRNSCVVDITATGPGGQTSAKSACVNAMTFAAVSSAAFIRPSDTTAYASGDLVANSTTAGSVAAMSFPSVLRGDGGTATVTRARLVTTSTSTTNASFRIHLYTSAPTATNGDNGVWLTTRSGRFCAIDVTIDAVFSDAAQGVGTPVAGSTCTFALTSGAAIRGLIEARAAYTPTSAGTFTVELEVLQ